MTGIYVMIPKLIGSIPNLSAIGNNIVAKTRIMVVTDIVYQLPIYARCLFNNRIIRPCR